MLLSALSVPIVVDGCDAPELDASVVDADAVPVVVPVEPVAAPSPSPSLLLVQPAIVTKNRIEDVRARSPVGDMDGSAMLQCRGQLARRENAGQSTAPQSRSVGGRVEQPVQRGPSAPDLTRVEP